MATDAELRYVMRVQDDEIKRLQRTLRETNKLVGGLGPTASRTGRDLDRMGDRGGRSLKQMTRGAIAGSGAFRSMGKAIAFASAGFLGAAGLTAVIRGAFDELSEAAKVGAQTNSVLKSTGGVAGVTAKDVDRLAAALMRKTGIDDEMIASGENWLLTFKNVRNVVGENNDIFDQATRAALDLAVAQANAKGGTVSMATAANMLGKALNDPIKGVTALSRIGVTFSQAQKAQIKSLVEANKMLEAQKLILVEVRSQVEGSAKSYGNTLPGQIAKAREAFRNLSASALKPLVPQLSEAAQKAAEFFSDPKTQRDLTQLSKEVGTFLRDAASLAGELARDAKAVSDAVGGWKNAFSLVLSGVLAAKLMKFAGGIRAIGIAAGTAGVGGAAGTGAAGKVSSLRSSLLALGRMSAIAIAINLIINKPKFAEDWNLDRSLIEIITGQTPLDLVTGDPNQAPRPWKETPRGVEAGKQLSTFRGRSGARPVTGRGQLRSLGAALAHQSLSEKEAVAMLRGRGYGQAEIEQMLGGYRAELAAIRRARQAEKKAASAGAVSAVFGSGTKVALPKGAFAKGTPGAADTHGSSLLPAFSARRGVPRSATGAVDIGRPIGTPVLAPEAGRLTKTGGSPGSGVAGGPGGLSLYFIGLSGTAYYMTHMEWVARPGTYRENEVIGRVGAHVSGSHAHIEQSKHPTALQIAEGPGGSRTPPKRKGAERPDSGLLPKSDKVKNLLSQRLRLRLSEAEGTPGIKDDIAALKAQEVALEKLKSQTKRNSEKRIEIQEALNQTRAKITELQKKDEPKRKAFKLPLGIRTRLETAEGTAGLSDDLKRLQEARAFLAKALKGAKGERRLEILSELNSIKAKIKSVKEELLEAGSAASEFQQALAASGVDAAALAQVAGTIPIGLEVDVRDDFGRITEQLSGADLKARITKIRKLLAGVVDEKVRAKLQADLDRYRVLIGEGIDKVREEIEKRKDALGTAFSELTDRAFDAFDARTTALLDGIRDRLQTTTSEIEKWRSLLTPAEESLAAFGRAERADERAEAQSEVEKAERRLARLTAAGGSPGRIAEATHELNAARRRVARIDLEEQAETQRKARDEEAAAKQKAAEGAAAEEEKQLNASRAELRRKLQARVNTLQQGLLSGNLTAEQALAQLTGPGGIFEEFGIEVETSGFDIGLAFATGFLEAFPLFKAAVDHYRQYLIDNGFLAGETPEAGKLPPVTFTAGRGSRGAQPMALGGIVRRRPGGMLARLGEGRHDEAVIPLPSGGGLGGGNISITIPIENFWGDYDEFVRRVAPKIRREIVRIERRGGSPGLLTRD